MGIAKVEWIRTQSSSVGQKRDHDIIARCWPFGWNLASRLFVSTKKMLLKKQLMFHVRAASIIRLDVFRLPLIVIVLTFYQLDGLVHATPGEPTAKFFCSHLGQKFTTGNIGVQCKGTDTKFTWLYVEYDARNLSQSKHQSSLVDYSVNSILFYCWSFWWLLSVIKRTSNARHCWGVSPFFARSMMAPCISC